jgi:hypothetical protein
MSTDIGHGRPAAGAVSRGSGGGRGGGGGDAAAPAVIEARARHVPPDRIDHVLAQTGRVERRRRRVPAAAVVWLVVMIGLRADLDLSGLWAQVCGTLATLLAAAAGVLRPVARSALSQARARLGARPLRQLMLMTGRSSLALTTPPTRGGGGGDRGGDRGGGGGGAYYKGMRLLAMDGDDYKLPDTPANAAAFGRPSTARDGTPLAAGYPQLHLTRLIDVGTRVTIEAVVKRYASGDHGPAPRLLAAARPGDLVLWDCGFYSFNLMRLACDRRTFFCAPVPANAMLTPVRRLGDGSYLVRLYDPSDHRRHDERSAAGDGGRGGGGAIVLRVIEYTLDEPLRVGHGERHRLITNLLDDGDGGDNSDGGGAHPARELVALYHERWEIEIANDEITTHQLGRPVELRSRTPGGAVQEVYGVLLAHNAVRLMMAEAAATAGTATATATATADGGGAIVDPRTLSFVNAVRVVREGVRQMRDAPANRLPVIYQGMLALIAAGRLPPRDGRVNPRVVKVVRPKNFPAKRPEHRGRPQPARSFLDSVVMLK